METKEFMKVLGDRIFQLLKENGKGYAVSILANYLNVPISYNPRQNAASAFNTILSWPRNSSEAAIDALLKTGKSAWSDSDKLRTANDIFRIAKTADDPIKTYAIRAIQELQSQMWSSSGKTRANSLITALAQNERKDK